MRPVRVLLIAPSLAIPGGQAVQAARLLASLRTETCVSVEFLPINPQLPGPLRLLQKVKYLRTVVTTGYFLIQLAAMTRRAQVLHVFAATGLSFWLHPAPALLAARLFRKKIVLNFRDGRAGGFLARRPRAAGWIARFDAVVTPSGYLAEVFAPYSIHARPIPNLIDAENFVFRERLQPTPVFLHNRALEPLYNVPCTLRAFALIQQRYPQAQLTLAHDGPLRAELMRLVRELGLHNVRFLGVVSRAETPRVLNEADIYLTSPDIDNMPGSILECFASGLPVVATRAGGIPFVVEHERTGLLAPIGDHAALAHAAMRLLEDPGLAFRLAAAARAECERYRWPAVRDEWLDLYGELSRR